MGTEKWNERQIRLLAEELKVPKPSKIIEKVADFEKIYMAAHKLAYEAASNHRPTPMIVEQHLNSFDDGSPVVQSWKVDGGVCGFAWVSIKPGTSKFARWLKENEIGQTDSYRGGVCIWVHDFGQSMECKEKYAGILANELYKALHTIYPKLTIHSYSRMD